MSIVNGYLESSGEYVIFLDADDFLYSDCVAFHVFAHLSLRTPVGLTSVDMVQITNERIACATSQGFSEFILKEKTAASIGNFREFVGICQLYPSIRHLDLKKNMIYYVPPSASNTWPWSPTSANCFRREALDLVIHNHRLEELKSCSDIYLLRGVAALSGSALIDRPLAAYRIHATNAFIKRPTIHRIRVFDVDYLAQKSPVAMRLLIDHLINALNDLRKISESENYIVEALVALDSSWPPIISDNSSYLLKKLFHGKKKFIEILGRKTYYELCLRATFAKYKRNDGRPVYLHFIEWILLVPMVAVVELMRVRRMRIDP